MQNKISRSWNNQMQNLSNGQVVSPKQQSPDISPCTVKLSPDFGNLGVGLVNGYSNSNNSIAMKTPPSSSISFSHTSKGQLRYNRHEALSCLENFCSVTCLSTITAACMDDKKAKEEAALAQIAREESENRGKMLIIPKSNHRLPRQTFTSRLPTHEEMMLEVKGKFEDIYRQYCVHEKELSVKFEREFRQSMQEVEHQTRRSLVMQMERQDADTAEVERRQQEVRTAHEQHAKILAARMHQADQEARQIEEQRKLDQQQKRIMAVLKEQEKVKSCADGFARLLSSCPFPQQLSSQTVQNYSDILNQITDKMSSYLTKAQNGDQFDTDKVRQFAEQAKRVVTSFIPFIEEAKKKGEEEMKKRQEDEEKKKSEAEKRSQQLPKNNDLRQQLPTSSGQDVPAQVGHNGANNGANNGASSDSAQMANILVSYVALQEIRKAAEQNCSTLVNNSQLKQYRFDLQIAINTTVNAIQAVSASNQLQEKLVLLNRLLSGEVAEVSGKKVSTRGHAAGAMFARDLLAKQFTIKGDTIASCPESAFAIASVCLGIWCEHPEVGYLVLAHLHLKCPYTVPYYFQKGQESTEDYLKNQGYACKSGKMEEQKEFLKRMAGYVILYAAITVSSPPNSSHPHPHGLEYAWQWLSCVLKYDPRPDITATVLFNFLEIAGHSLMNHYRRQFWKLLRLISDDYLPKIVNAKGSAGPVTQLQNFLHEALRTGRISEPKGYLRPGFWSR